MATWTNLNGSDYDANSPITSTLTGAWYNNPIAIAEGATGAPKVDPAAIDTTKLYNFNSITVGGNETLSEIANITKMYSGQVAADGTWIDQPGSWTVSKNLLNVYTITHNLGTSNFAFIGSSENGPFNVGVSSKTTTTVVVYVVDGSNSAYARDFDFILIVN
jgi:hypothetical protein